jgi:hydrogenase nickel incorporation protein HypB
MCTHCGCSSSNEITVTNLQTGRHVHLHDDFDPDAPIVAHSHDHHHGQGHDHSHGHSHAHDHSHSHEHSHAGDRHRPQHAFVRPAAPRRTIRIEEELLAKNARLAERNRGWLAGRGVVAINVMSSPGAGKTTLLERTLKDLGAKIAFHVIEGDQATLRDAERIRAAGGKAVQVNTGAGCHLDAAMVAAALQQLDPPSGGIVLIENVGNLVCPALFDLGERARVVVASVTEGDDKPLKYPHMFRAADVVVLNKIDLAAHVDFDLTAFEDRARELNPRVRLVRVSARTGEGMEEWHQWLSTIP